MNTIRTLIRATIGSRSLAGLYTLERDGRDTLVRPVGRHLEFGQDIAVLREVLATHPDLVDAVKIEYDDETGQEVFILSPREAGDA